MKRREFLERLGAFTLLVAGSSILLPRRGIFAQPKEDKERIAKSEEAIREITGGQRLRSSRDIELNIPETVEDGASVACNISIDHPMEPDNYIKSIHLISRENLDPITFSINYQPHGGRAGFSTRIRLAKGQEVVAIAETSKGRFLYSKQYVRVAAGGC